MPPRLTDVRWILFDAVGTLIYPDPPVSEAYQTVALRFCLQLAADEIRRRFLRAFQQEFVASGLTRPPTSESFERARWQRIVTKVLHELPDASGGPFEVLWQHFARAASWRVFLDVAP